MKRIVSIILAASLLLAMACLSSCGGKTPAAPATAADADAEKGFTLSADQTALSPGDTFTVTLKGAGWKNVACFDVLLSASDNLSVVSYKEKDVGDFTTTVSQLEEGVKMGAYVMYTYDIEDMELLTVTYRIAETAKTGDKAEIQAQFTQFLVGTDPSGDKTEEQKGDISVAPLILSID